MKDKEGYYWLGTQDGLNRYDGYSVKIFRHDKDDSTTISDNFILNIQEDPTGNLWIGTRNGFNHFNKKTEIFSKIISNEKERTNFHSSVWNVFIDANENILYSNSYSELVTISHEDSKATPFFPKIIIDNTRLFKSSAKTYCQENNSNTITCLNSDGSLRWEMTDTALSRIYCVVETENKRRIFGTTQGLFFAEDLNPRLISVPVLSDKRINKLLCDSRQNIWVGTTSGLYVFEGGDLTETPRLLTHLTEDIHSIPSNSIQELYEDPNELIWVGTSEGGVSIYDPQKSIFKILNHTSPIPLSANSTWGIYQDKNELWIGTSYGLNHLTFQNPKIAGIYSGKNNLLSNEVFVMNNSYPNSICGNSITSIEKDKTGSMWFASNSNGISIYDPISKSWKQLNSRNSPLKSDVIFHLLCASDGKMWISTLAGFYCHDPIEKTIRSFPSAGMEKAGFPSGYIISIFEDAQKTIWVASASGIYHLKSNGERIALYASEVNNEKSLSYNIATSFYQDRKGRMWIATLGGGINLFDPKTKSFHAFTQKDGLSNDIIYKILEDKNGKLWISSNTGLSCFDPKKESFTNYSEKDGLVANEFSQNSGFVNDSGELFFGSPEGLVIFDPSKIVSTLKNIPIIISSLKINYEPVKYSSGDPTYLFYGDKTLTFEFTAPDFRNQEKIQYAFQLEGFDNTWHQVPASNRIASFTNLPFGNYIFKARIKIGNNAWQEEQLAVKVNVIPPFWLRTWFILLEILAGLVVVVLLVRYYAQRQLKKRLQKIEMQQKIHFERERISRDLHDNVGAHLTYIITSLDGISYKIEKGEKDISKEKISYLSDFSRSTMQQLRESIWAINKENITLCELKDKISEYASRMAAASNMNFTIDFDSQKDSPLKPSHAINIYRVVQEAINNSIKHSEAKSLSVSISKNGKALIFIDVIDNGKGMNGLSTNNGYGMKNMQDRVKDLGGDISIDSNEKGTRISFTIPI